MTFGLKYDIKKIAANSCLPAYMSYFNYQKICENLLKDLPDRNKEIINRRFGFDSNKKETLDSIGASYGITRERIRQIEQNSFEKIKQKNKTAQKVFLYFEKQLKIFGGLKRENLFLEKIGKGMQNSRILFLLKLSESFKRFPETDRFYALWALNVKSLDKAKKVINIFNNELKKENNPIRLENSRTSKSVKLEPKVLLSYIEISKHILRNKQGLYGFSDWPEIKSRSIKDKAFLELKKQNQPLHFRKIAESIQKQEKKEKPYLFKTVHNELIKNPMFVLIGRGTYALRNWGYESGVVKEVIIQILKKANRPLSKQEIAEQVLKQRIVKKNTVFLNLNNKKYFLKDKKGRYIIRQA